MTLHPGQPYIVFAPRGTTAVMLDQSTSFVHAWQLAGKVKREKKLPMVSVGSIRTEPDDTKYVSDEQLERHVLWRTAMWIHRWPHLREELTTKGMELAAQFAGPGNFDTFDLALSAIPQPHRWEFLWRFAAITEYLCEKPNAA